MFAKISKFLAFIIALAIFAVPAYLKLTERSSAKENSTVVILPTPTQEVSPSPSLLSTPLQTPNLKDIVENSLRDAPGTYGIVIQNLRTGENYFYNEHTSFNAASLYKLWVMAQTFDQIQKGLLSENDILSQDIQVLNSEFDIDPSYADQTLGTVTMSTDDALNKMITVSDNDAALLLSDKLTLSSVSDFLSKNNFQESRLGEPPVTTPYDIAMFFEKLYSGELADSDSTWKMTDLLKKQALNGKIPKYLPPETVIAHKTGEIDTYTHDAGIVYSPKGDYVIVIMTESDSPDETQERIARLSRSVYDYFSKT
ncbi:class A beta-lactamase-related serine hydrolase [Patescibacteria group bacterium]|nr:class A beta-lactamase-related serine hydrolase [Patescibacteria group bacterium]MCL5797235.1 class A beta-lactamase-related serine hydrolase [Patescibacteria group bacterium]